MKRKTALILIDCINDLDFPAAESLLPWAEKLIQPILALKKRARENDIPIVYVNDNFGLWDGEFSSVYKHCTRKKSLGKRLSTRLKPRKDDAVILKPRHSIFFHTSLVPFLEDLKVKHLILTGIATNLCVLYSAHEAQMLTYGLTVASDCCAAETNHDHDEALRQLKKFSHVRIARGDEIRF